MTPPPFPPPARAIRASAVWAGVGLGLLGHLLLAGVVAAALWGPGDSLDEILLSGSLVGELVLVITVVTAGTLLIVKGHRGLGLGLFIGWAAGLIALPVIGFGVCVYEISRQ